MVEGGKCLWDPRLCRERENRLYDIHMKPLTEFVQRIRSERNLEREVPFFDPEDGGINAECLFVLEAPGPRAVCSGFVSRNNDDDSAYNFLCLNCHPEVDIQRERTLIWNIVPWYLGKDNSNRNRNPKRKDVDEGWPYLLELIDLLRMPVNQQYGNRLRAIVLVGDKAKGTKERLQRIDHRCAVFTCPHPSPQYVNRKVEHKRRILGDLRHVKEFLTAEEA